MPVSPLPLSPEANDLESIDEDAPCPPPLAAPIAAYSSSYQPSRAAPIAEPSSYLLASIEKPIVQSVQHITSANSIIIKFLPYQACAPLATDILTTKHREEQLPQLRFTTHNHTKFCFAEDQSPVPPKPPDPTQCSALITMLASTCHGL